MLKHGHEDFELVAAVSDSPVELPEGMFTKNDLSNLSDFTGLSVEELYELNDDEIVAWLDDMVRLDNMAAQAADWFM